MISSRFIETPFAAGVVGSLPRPPAVKNMLPDTPGAQSSAAAWSTGMDAAVRYAIALQETAGAGRQGEGICCVNRNGRREGITRDGDRAAGCNGGYAKT